MAKAPFNSGKLALFTASTAIGGLAQVWLLYVALIARHKEHTLSSLLGDGGLFFFTTSLAVTSALMLFERLPRKPTSWDLFWTILVLAICGIAVVFYISVLIDNLKVVAPFHDHVGPQVGCASIAFFYAFFAAARTGYFRK